MDKQEEYAIELRKTIVIGQQAREVLKHPYMKRFLRDEIDGCVELFKILEPNDDKVLGCHTYFLAVNRLEERLKADIENGDIAAEKLKSIDKMKGVNI
jgi:hypothetical protein